MRKVSEQNPRTLGLMQSITLDSISKTIIPTLKVHMPTPTTAPSVQYKSE